MWDNKLWAIQYLDTKKGRPKAAFKLIFRISDYLSIIIFFDATKSPARKR
jgi:hypothetical protein